jgi:hypothetical protein|tara:strand:- start:461 stop:1891 length:1431 start_codon:yes stop_codon:yes gene_type:complete
MPRVKTIRPGRLTGISGLTQDAARQLGRQKDIEYQYALQDWRAEKAKLEGIKQEQLNYLDQKMKMIAGEEQAGGETFDEKFKKAQMEQAKEYANIVSDIKLGNIDAADGYAKLAVFDQSLKNIETAIPNINALNKKLQEAMNKEEGEVGAFIYDGSGKTFEIAQLFNDMYSPTRSGNVSTVIEDGKTFLVHKDGQRISIEGLNAIMSGENPDYPINFVQDPREALKAVHDVMMKENDSEFKIRKGSRYINDKGQTVTTKKDQYYLGKGSNYNERLNEAVMPILNDNEKMKGFWLNLGGEGNWDNSEAQRKIAKQALVDMARNSFGPKNDVISIDISLPKGSEEDTNKNLTATQIKQKNIIGANKAVENIVLSLPRKPTLAPGESRANFMKREQDALKQRKKLVFKELQLSDPKRYKTGKQLGEDYEDDMYFFLDGNRGWIDWGSDEDAIYNDALVKSQILQSRGIKQQLTNRIEML